MSRDIYKLDISADDWGALQQLNPSPYARAQGIGTPTAPTSTPEGSFQPQLSSFTPPLFFQTSQYNTCWLLAPDKTPVFVLYECELLGKGNFAKVYKAISPQYVNLELVVRQSLQSPPHCDLFTFEGVFAHNATARKSYCTLLPKAERDLANYIFSKNSSRALPPSDEQDIFSTSISTVRALHYLHQKDIAHLDVKPSNFMRMPDGKIILMDPDFAEPAIRQRISALKGTPYYINPLFMLHSTKEAVDQFALRRTLYMPNKYEVLLKFFAQNGKYVTCTLQRSQPPADSSLCWIMPDDFFNGRPYLKEIISTEKFRDSHVSSIPEILCILILAKHDLFEPLANKRFPVFSNDTSYPAYKVLPPALTALLLAYQEHDPECALLGRIGVRSAIETIVQNANCPPEKSEPTIADLRRILFPEAVSTATTHSPRLFHVAQSETSGRNGYDIVQKPRITFMT